MSVAEKKSHKDWFDRNAAKALAQQIGSVYGDFDSKRFRRLCSKNLESLEFQARVQQFSDALLETLPANYPKAANLLSQSFPDVLPNCDSVTDGWLQWPVGQFIADHGLPHLDESMQCMVELTQRFSAEYAVRPFVQHRAEETFDYLYSRLSDDSAHVRRWCSEGCRTRLPWGTQLKALIADPSPIVPILEALKDDEELYVRKSVANNVNDLSKDHPQLVIKLCRDWSKHSNENRDWVIKQGLRTLIKNGDKETLKLIGFTKPVGVNTKLKLSSRKIVIGESVSLTAALHNTGRKTQQLLIDYIVHYQGKSTATRQKVFKWKTVSLKAGEEVVLEKNHAMKLTSVRALYPGKHKIEMQVNGEQVAHQNFELVDPDESS